MLDGPQDSQRGLIGLELVVQAALKRVPAYKYRPFEAIQTNVLGRQKAMEASVDRAFKRVWALSTDQAANPARLHGATSPGRRCAV